MERKPPYACRYATIRCASVGPMPSSESRSSTEALERLTARLPPGPAPRLAEPPLPPPPGRGPAAPRAPRPAPRGDDHLLTVLQRRRQVDLGAVGLTREAARH